MVERTVRIVNDPGLHLRSASSFVKTAARFKSDVWVMKDGIEVNGKSILGVISLVAEYGSSITIRAKGDDEEQAIASLATLVENRFYERE
jgi:phosphocarrier protein